MEESGKQFTVVFVLIVTEQVSECTEYTEWLWPLSGAHSIMMVKSAQPGEGGSVRPHLFTLSIITSNVLVYAPAERADTLPLFLLYPLYVFCE
jgi:hypothetical protein